MTVRNCANCGKAIAENEMKADTWMKYRPPTSSAESARAITTYYFCEDCWSKRGRIVGGQAGSGCPFYNADKMCVDPALDRDIVPCSLNPILGRHTYLECFIYPRHRREQDIWQAELAERKKVEAEMEGEVGKCKICGSTQKLNLNQVCSICILAIERANKLFDERGKDTLICDWCMKQVKKGEAYLTVRKTYLCCIDDWKDFAK